MTASFTFTADAGTDTITTSAPHGKVTGDGPMVVRNVGGALPTGYTALLDVYAIVTGASTMKLALSSADALANIPILISDAGTGTHYLEIGIPYRRPRTYAPGVQLKSADLNDNFDALKALHALLTGQSQGIWAGVRLLEALTVVGGIVVPTGENVELEGTAELAHGDRTLPLPGVAWDSTVGTRSTGPVKTTSTGAGSFFLSIPLKTRDRVKSFTVAVFGNAGTNITQLDLIKTTAAGVDSVLATTAVPAPAAAWQDILLSPSATELAAGDSLSAFATVDGAGIALGNSRTVHDRLPI
jgi:hypothetical protein